MTYIMEGPGEAERLIAVPAVLCLAAAPLTARLSVCCVLPADA
jgi:hypothetical protein